MTYVASVTPYATLLMVLVSVLSGFLTFRLWQRTRYLTTAVQLVQTIQDANFSRSIQLIMRLHQDSDALGIAADKETLEAAYVVSHAFESLGIMVYHRLLPIYLVDQLVGGYVRSSWSRLQSYTAERRKVLGPTFSEWFQWLAERLREMPATPESAVGAARAHASWRPHRGWRA